MTKAYKYDMLAAVTPRLILVCLSIAQPFMIGQTVAFLQDSSTSNNTGYGLLGAFVVVFISTAVSSALTFPGYASSYLLAVYFRRGSPVVRVADKTPGKISTALYQHLGYRVMTMLRGGLIAALYDKMMSLPVEENVSESGAMALMGSDVEALAEYFHATITDTWADALQLCLAVYLLARMIGAICVAPIIVAIRKLKILNYGGQH